MNIFITLKSVLNYLYNNLIDLIWTKKIKFADGTEQTTAGNSGGSFSLFDIKVMSQAIAEKGFAFMCHTDKRSLSKTVVPTLYNNIKNKYDNCNTGMTTLTASMLFTGYGSSLGVFYNPKQNKYIIAHGNLYCQDSLQNGEIQTRIGNIVIGENYYNNNCFCGNNVFLVPDLNDKIIYKIDLSNWNIKATTIPTNNDTYYRTYKLKDGYIYIQSDNNVYKIKDDYNDDTIEVLNNDGNIITFDYSTYYKKWIVVKTDGIYETTDFSNFVLKNSSHIPLCIWCYKDKIFFTKTFLDSSSQNYLYYTQDFFANITEILTNSEFFRYSYAYSIDNKAYLLKTYTANTNRVSYTLNMDDITLSPILNLDKLIKYSNYISETEDFVFADSSDQWLYYSGISKTVYTDTYIINNTTVDIDYYKYEDFKICLSDGGSNDTNLETVFNYLGYLNYWILDIVNETVSIQRDNTNFKVMFVGDNFIDDTDNLNFTVLSVAKRIIGSTAPTTSTIGNIGDIYVDTENNAVYVCTSISGSTYNWLQL